MLLQRSGLLQRDALPARRRDTTSQRGTPSTARRRGSGPRLMSLSRSSLFQSVASLTRRIRRKPRPQPAVVEARVRDPDLAQTEEEDPDKEPPSAFWRAMSAFTYLVPWIDAVGMGREIYHKFPTMVYLYFASSPFFAVYYCSQFAPLIIFFLMFLAVVKNTKLSHFIRFNCMQAIMLDIAVMLFTILHMYFPPELRWSWVLPLFDMFTWIWSMSTIIFCVFFTLKGVYADIPYISEAVYIQVELSDRHFVEYVSLCHCVPHRMDSSTGPEFHFTSDIDFPNKVKIRKRIPFWLLEFTIGVDHDRLKHTLSPTCVVKDKFLKGVIDLNLPEQRVEYRKVCGFPFIGQLVLNAGLNYRNPLRSPRIGLHFNTAGPAAVASCEASKFDQRISLGKRVGLEFIGEIRRAGPVFEQDLGEGPLNVHLQEMNAIIKL